MTHRQKLSVFPGGGGTAAGRSGAAQGHRTAAPASTDSPQQLALDLYLEADLLERIEHDDFGAWILSVSQHQPARTAGNDPGVVPPPLRQEGHRPKN